jgi:hypothetical protein
MLSVVFRIFGKLTEIGAQTATPLGKRYCLGTLQSCFRFLGTIIGDSKDMSTIVLREFANSDTNTPLIGLQEFGKRDEKKIILGRTDLGQKNNSQ